MSSDRLVRALALLAMASTLPAQAVPDLGALAWTTTDVGLGVTLRTAWTDRLFDAPQSLAVLDVDAAAPAVQFALVAPEPFARVRTSQLARDAGAFAAVNGGFFDVANGTPDGLLRIAGVQRAPHAPRRDAALVIGADGRVGFVDLAPTTREAAPFPHALAAWPRLVRAGAIAEPTGFSKTDRRHPRTAVGTTADGHVLFVTVDGRMPEAAGMTLVELAATLQALGCTDALNLDGGGSSTLWIDGHVANHPCDDRVFDHAGERAVANAVLVFAARVVVRDEESFRCAPTAAWQLVADPACIDGDALRSAAPAAHASIELVPPRTGSFDVELHLPRDATICVDLGSGPTTVHNSGQARWCRIDTGGVHAATRCDISFPAAATMRVLDAVRLVERVGT